MRPLFDLAAFAREFGDQYVLLVRSHYLERLVVPPSAAEAVIDVSAEHDTTPLLAAADALITDYSSVMFDYVLLDRPMIYYVPDYDDYVHHARGTYFSLAEVAPGPLAFTEEELFAALRELDTADTQYVKPAEPSPSVSLPRHWTAARAIVDRFFLRKAADEQRSRTARDLFLVANSVSELGGVTSWTPHGPPLHRPGPPRAGGVAPMSSRGRGDAIHDHLARDPTVLRPPRRLRDRLNVGGACGRPAGKRPDALTRPCCPTCCRPRHPAGGVVTQVWAME